MELIKISIEEAMKRCNGSDKILVAERDLEKADFNVAFTPKKKEDFNDVFKDVKTASYICENYYVQQLRLFTEHQEIPEIKQHGKERIVLINT